MVQGYSNDTLNAMLQYKLFESGKGIRTNVSLESSWQFVDNQLYDSSGNLKTDDCMLGYIEHWWIPTENNNFICTQCEDQRHGTELTRTL